jgi:hypothetical protein
MKLEESYKLVYVSEHQLCEITQLRGVVLNISVRYSRNK